MIATLLVLAGTQVAMGQYGPAPGTYGPGQMMGQAPIGPMLQPGMPGQGFQGQGFQGQGFQGQPQGGFQGFPQQGMAIGSGVSPIGAFAPSGPSIMQVGASMSCSDGCTSAGGGCAAAGGGSCGDIGCSSCGAGCGNSGCGCSGNKHSWSIYGEFLYLRARDAEVVFAHETNAAVAPPGIPIPVQPLGIVDPDFQPGFRGGVTMNLDQCSSVSAQYTMFESSTFNRVDRINNVNGIYNLLTHPSTAQAAQTGVFSDAKYDISFDAIDLDYRQLISSGCDHKLHMLVGVRYGNLEQQLFSNLPINGNETVDTDIDFEGIGARLGLEYEHQLRRGLSVYSRLHGSLLAGEWSADYDQGNNFDASVVNTGWKAGRITPVIDFELGMGWTSKSGAWKMQAGYLYSTWMNAVTTDDWIDSVRRNNYVDMESNITFDGLTARIETRF
jgi:hypothetical protein